ncbi:MAG: hypothetical protein HY731_06370 [Candidatus Tectomicrobia bacterium]|nr:hypothetical protein [Candidatus Tectomicrobia bacterium]
MTELTIPAVKRPLARKAVALLSGGLDSTLAVKIIMDQGIEVLALTFLTYFGCDGESSCGHDTTTLAGKLGFKVKLCHLGHEYVEMVKNPKFGYGKNMNPCLDCRIMMISEAAKYMEAVGASFIITGEVVGQRPMSQRRDTLNVSERESGLKGYILRPLSAKLLEPTIPEIEGTVDREKLYGISGRSRKIQMELAEKYGITDYPNAGGGCLLTDANYARKLKDLFKQIPTPSFTDLTLLKMGRHFRIHEECRVMVGRHQTENEFLAQLAEVGDYLFYVSDYKGPTTLVRGAMGEGDISIIARITTRYSQAPSSGDVRVVYKKAGEEQGKEAWIEAGIDEMKLEALRI